MRIKAQKKRHCRSKLSKEEERSFWEGLWEGESKIRVLFGKHVAKKNG